MSIPLTADQRRAIIATAFEETRLATAIEDEVASAMQRKALDEGHARSRFAPINRQYGGAARRKYEPQIIAALRSGPRRAAELAGLTGSPKGTMASILLAMSHEGKVQRTEVRRAISWSLPEGTK